MIDFTQKYDRKEWIHFLKDRFLPDDFHAEEKRIEYTEKYTQEVTKLGECSSLNLSVFEIKHQSQNDARVGLSKETFALVRKYTVHNRALALFVPQNNNERYRFSFIEFTPVVTEQGKTKREYSNPRRYSYLLGKDCKRHTPEEMLVTKGKVGTIDELSMRFAIDVVTKQFYKEIFDWYQWALSGEAATAYPNGSNEEHLIRLITRLMFVWFIKQKGLIPEDIFDSKELSYILKDFDPLSGKSGNYYNAILQNLFFATLNRPITDREFASGTDGTFQGKNDQYGIKTLYRDDNKQTWFKKPNKEIIELFKRVPFLNGGLFECLDKEDEKNGKILYFDGFSRDKSRRKRAFVPNRLFFDDTKGIISVLKRYNFTVEENTPLDVDVALDPELLGKVFENLLGAYNPETKETARKQSGSFYTPREIVSYMVDESLIAYLTQKIDKRYKGKIRELFAGNTMDNEPVALPDTIKSEICMALWKCKILDPSCGSGAFPMGILNRMLDILKKLQADINVYDTKLKLIENCIYGVDIQTIAIQISKLRFFISLICEQTPDDNPNMNYGIIPLPNLESKFVAANTLIGLDKERKDELNLENEDLKEMRNELMDIRCHKSVRASSWQEKKQLRNDDKELCRKIKEYLLANSSSPDIDKIEKNEKQIGLYKAELADLPEIWVDDYQKAIQNELFGSSKPQTLFRKDINSEKRNRIADRIKTLENEIAREKRKGRLSGLEGEIDKITGWNPYDQNASSSFFDPYWMFGVEDGFDIVIGNPPYVQLQNNHGELADKYKDCNYKTFVRTGDMYQLFYEQGMNFLCQNGYLCFITSNKWMRAGYGEKTRKFLTENVQTIQLIDFAGQKVFESATVDVNIILLEKTQSGHETLACIIKEDCKSNMTDYVRQSGTHVSFPKNGESWVILSDIEQRIKAKIERVGTPLKDWDISINYGIKTGCNEAFIIGKEKRDELIAKDAKSAEIIRPILRGRDIKRYGYEFADQYIIATFPSRKYNIDDYPAVRDYLLQYGKKRLEQSGKPGARKKTSHKWFETQDPIAYWDDFFKQKIVWTPVNSEYRFAFVEEGIFFNNSLFMMTGEHLKYLLSLFNSKLFIFYLDKILANGNYAYGSGNTFKNISVPKPDIETEQKIKSLLEMQSYQEIDKLVYVLYGLTKEEIQFIDSQ